MLIINKKNPLTIWTIFYQITNLSSTEIDTTLRSNTRHGNIKNSQWANVATMPKSKYNKITFKYTISLNSPKKKQGCVFHSTH